MPSENCRHLVVRLSARDSIGVISVAAVGVSATTGRLPIRRGLTVILGCFIIFGASTIAAGLADVPRGAPGPAVAPLAPPALFAVPPTATRSPLPPQVFDPYAGALVPPR